MVKFLAGCLLVLAEICVEISSRTCSDGEWSCLDGRRCISQGLVCDFNVHCGDGSDEWGSFCEEWQCPEGFFKCEYNRCIPEKLVCDSWANCADISDEKVDCYEWSCSPGTLNHFYINRAVANNFFLNCKRFCCVEVKMQAQVLWKTHRSGTRQNTLREYSLFM